MRRRWRLRIWPEGGAHALSLTLAPTLTRSEVCTPSAPTFAPMHPCAPMQLCSPCARGPAPWSSTPTRPHAHTPTRPHAHTPTRPHAQAGRKPKLAACGRAASPSTRPWSAVSPPRWWVAPTTRGSASLEASLEAEAPPPATPPPRGQTTAAGREAPFPSGGGR